MMQQILYATGYSVVSVIYEAGVWGNPILYSNDTGTILAGISAGTNGQKNRSVIVFQNYDLPDNAEIQTVELKVSGVSAYSELPPVGHQPRLHAAASSGIFDTATGGNSELAFNSFVMSGPGTPQEMTPDGGGYPLEPGYIHTFTRDVTGDLPFDRNLIASGELEFSFVSDLDINNVEPVGEFEYLHIFTNQMAGTDDEKPQLIVYYEQIVVEPPIEDPAIQVCPILVNRSRRNMPGMSLSIRDKRRP